MTVLELLKKNRSYRRFDASYKVSRETLETLVALTRYTASTANKQFLKYICITDPELCSGVIERIGWAGYIKNWDRPEPQEQPPAYIIIALDTALASTASIDPGIAAQSILLGAVDQGLGGCMFSSLKKDSMRELLGLDTRYELQLVIAIGKPVETVVIEDAVDNEIKYYRDEDQIHHVPKRSLQELLLEPKK